MKTVMMAALAVVLMSGAAFAQDDVKKANKAMKKEAKQMKKDAKKVGDDTKIKATSTSR